MGHNWGDIKWVVPRNQYSAVCDVSCRFVEKINHHIGRTAAWLALLMAITTFVLVVARYGFNVGSIKLQESVVYMHAMLFMLCGAYCFQNGFHVRIDIFYAKLSARGKSIVDLLGIILFLLPTCLFTFYISLEYVGASWSYQESSSEPSGLAYLYLLKTLLLIMPVTIMLQGLADLCRHFCFLSGWLEYPAKETLNKLDTHEYHLK